MILLHMGTSRNSVKNADSMFVAEGEGLQDIVTFREKTGKILRNYYSLPKGNDEEAQKRAILETAAKLIKSYIKTMVAPTNDVYLDASQLRLEPALQYIPDSLRVMLQNLCWEGHQ